MNDTILLGPWVRRFLLEHLVAERNLAANTKKSYRDMLMLLLPYVARKLKKPIDRLTVTDLSAQVVRLFPTYLEQQRGCSVATRNQRLGGVHALARFIGEHSPEHIEWYGQIRLIPFKKGSQPSITYLDRREMDALLAAHDKHSAQGRREEGLILFLYNSGARASEASQLKIKDIDWHAQCVRIIGKGNKQRRCPLWADTLDQLRVLASERDGSEPVFLNRCDRPMTRSGIHTLVKRCAARAGDHVPSLKDKKVGPHVIRHSTASHLLQSGVDINTIRAWLGYVSLTTTNVYAEISLETKARALATCAVSATTKARKRWSAQPHLMEFLRKL
ncbi:tyrosine-type recombinase/integrase [Paraburkholderia sediminicola]|uniref:Tyrosine-type recombinase/integrase n=1 Tax=Paraburkholderia rhynchosiae TaxID=487049 RepID=A0ACC7NNL8_9BURK